MKILAFILVILGTGLAAASGARNIDNLVERQTLEAQGLDAEDHVNKARAAYCEEREAAGLAAGDGCGGVELEMMQPDPLDEARDEAGLRAVGRSRARKLKEARPDALPRAVAGKRAVWTGLYEDTIGTRALGRARVTVPGPGARLSSWASMTGVWFTLGLVLVIAGAILARVAVRREVTRPEGGGQAPSEADGVTGTTAPSVLQSAGGFEGSLEELLEGARALATRIAEASEPGEADFLEVQREVERLQLDCVEPLVASRGHLQARYGMAAFAAIFGPLSAGERNLNRTWSALVDRHWPEATRSAEVACYGLEEAMVELEKVRARAS